MRSSPAPAPLSDLPQSARTPFHKKRTGSIITAAAMKSPRSFAVFLFVFPLPVFLSRTIFCCHVSARPESRRLVRFRKFDFRHIDHHLLFLFRRRSRHSARLFLSHKILSFLLQSRLLPSADITALGPSLLREPAIFNRPIGLSAFSCSQSSRAAAGYYKGLSLTRKPAVHLPSVSVIALVFPLDPGHQKVDDPALLILGKLPALRHSIPFFQTAPAAAGTCVLCEKYRMTTHRRLLPVIGDLRRCKPLCNKIFGMAANGVHTFLHDIVPILLCQMKFSAKAGGLQFGQRLIDGLHVVSFL